MKDERRPMNEIVEEFIQTQTKYLEEELRRLDFEQTIRERQLQILNGIDILPKPAYQTENPYRTPTYCPGYKRKSKLKRFIKHISRKAC